MRKSLWIWENGRFILRLEPKNLVFLDCINTILPEEELSAETDKDSEWHGFGIHNIHKIVQKYDGEFELSMEKNTAAAHAALHKNL